MLGEPLALACMLHFGMQLVFSSTFAAVATSAGNLPGSRPHCLQSASEFAVQYAVVNTMRWTLNGSYILLAFDWARCECAAASARRRALKLQRGRARPHRAIGLGAYGVGSLLIGLAFTLPFSLWGGRFKPRPTDMGTDWWFIYGRQQALTDTIAYDVLTLFFTGCLLAVAIARRIAVAETSPPRPVPLRREPLLPSRESGFPVNHSDSVAERDEVLNTLASHGGEASEVKDAYPCPLRLSILIVCSMIRCGGQSAICTSVLAESTSQMYTAPATVVELLLLMTTLEDGQGLISSLVYGMQPHSAIERSAPFSCACAR